MIDDDKDDWPPPVPNTWDDTRVKPSELDITTPKVAGLWAYPAETVELAFRCWIEADRSVSRAMLRFDQVSNGARNPDRGTWHLWVKNHNWSVKADEAVLAAFPSIRRRQFARISFLSDRALELDAAIIAGEHDHDKPAILQAKVATSTVIKHLAGLGASVIGPPSVPPAPAVLGDDEDDPVDARQRHLDRLREQRQGKP